MIINMSGALNIKLRWILSFLISALAVVLWKMI